MRQDATLIGLVGWRHCISHFSQLLLPPLFPWLKDAFGVSYAELGLLMSIFFVVSCACRRCRASSSTASGRARAVRGLALLGLAPSASRPATSYWMLALFSVVAGVGNGVFHPSTTRC
jgi:predicted MFS family arabinose efflux permease